MKNCVLFSQRVEKLINFKSRSAHCVYLFSFFFFSQMMNDPHDGADDGQLETIMPQVPYDVDGGTPVICQKS